MSRPPTSSHAASPAPTTASILTSLLFLSILSPVSAANTPPAPLPTLHNVVAAAAAAAPPPPPPPRQHYNANRDAQQRQQQPSGPYTPLVTPAPSVLPDDQVLANQGFRQETYYTCMTAPSGREHCGWHTPVLKQAKQGGAVAAPGRATDARVVVVVVAALAGLFAVGMM